MAQLIFLGTAGSSAVVSKQWRSSGGIIIRKDDLQLHIDPGPGTLNKAKEYGINVHHTTAVLVTKNSVNHCNDLNAVIDAMTHDGIEHRGIILGSKSALQHTEKNSPFLSKKHKDLVEKIIPLEKNHKIGIEVIEIHALPSENDEENSIGFKFFFPKFILSYTGDTTLTEELLEELMGSDVLIMNVPFPGNKAQGKNLDTKTAIKIVSHVQPRLVIITHFGQEMLKADPIQEAREIQRITGVQTIAAQDGLVVSPGSYGKYKSPVKGF